MSLPDKYCSFSKSCGVSPESSFGITSARRSIMSPASCNALAFADSNFCCSASCSAAAAARLVFSHSARTSSMVICPVICGSASPCSGTSRLICPSYSSFKSSWKFSFKESSISWSVAMCAVSSPAASASFSTGICKYGISSTSFLMVSML